MEATHERRRLHWPDCLNARDLGGYPTQYGRPTRWGALVRTDNPAKLTREAMDEVVRYGIRTVLDLRHPEETASHPHPLRRLRPEVSYLNIPLRDPVDADRDLPTFTTLANNYKRLVDLLATQLASAVWVVGHAGPGGVAVNCMGGKDRTGQVIALLLSVAGVTPDLVAEDYAISRERLMPDELAWLEEGPGERAERERAVDMFAAKAEVMSETLEHIRTKYGTVEEYLINAGLTQGDVDLVRERLLE